MALQVFSDLGTSANAQQLQWVKKLGITSKKIQYYGDATAHCRTEVTEFFFIFHWLHKSKLLFIQSRNFMVQTTSWQAAPCFSFHTIITFGLQMYKALWNRLFILSLIMISIGQSIKWIPYEVGNSKHKFKGSAEEYLFVYTNKNEYLFVFTELFLVTAKLNNERYFIKDTVMIRKYHQFFYLDNEIKWDFKYSVELLNLTNSRELSKQKTNTEWRSKKAKKNI